MTAQQISKRINKLAKDIMPTDMFTSFKHGDLACRIACIAMLAAQAGETKVVEACDQWFSMVK